MFIWPVFQAKRKIKMCLPIFKPCINNFLASIFYTPCNSTVAFRFYCFHFLLLFYCIACISFFSSAFLQHERQDQRVTSSLTPQNKTGWTFIHPVFIYLLRFSLPPRLIISSLFTVSFSVALPIFIPGLAQTKKTRFTPCFYLNSFLLTVGQRLTSQFLQLNKRYNRHKCVLEYLVL